MKSRLWLIVEDANDGLIIQKILDQKGYSIRVEIIDPTGGSGGISRLAIQLKKFIATVRSDPRFNEQNDCIAVLHDADSQQANRSHYENITSIYKANRVKLAVAHDELESWLLADSGVCQWFKRKPQNCDSLLKPSDEVRSEMQKKGVKYQGKYRQHLIDHITGDGEQFSPSMKNALRLLENAPCVLHS